MFKSLLKQSTGAAVFSAAIVLLLCLSVAVAEDAASPEGDAKEGKAAEEEEVVKTGTIASTGNYGFGPQSIKSGAGAPGDEPNVISASVSRTSKESCSVTFKNTSEKNGYSAGFRVIEINASGRKVNSKYLSASLAAQESKTHTVNCAAGNSMQVELVRATKK